MFISMVIVERQCYTRPAYYSENITYSQVHKCMDNDTIFVILAMGLLTMDLKLSNRDMIKVSTFSFNLRVLTQTLH